MRLEPRRTLRLASNSKKSPHSRGWPVRTLLCRNQLQSPSELSVRYDGRDGRDIAQLPGHGHHRDHLSRDRLGEDGVAAQEGDKTEAPSLIRGDAVFIRLYLAKSTPEASASQAQQQQDWRRLEQKMLDGETPNANSGSQRFQQRRCQEMKDDQRLESFAGLGESLASTEKEPHVVVQRPRCNDLGKVRGTLFYATSFSFKCCRCSCS